MKIFIIFHLFRNNICMLKLTKISVLTVVRHHCCISILIFDFFRFFLFIRWRYVRLCFCVFLFIVVTIWVLLLIVSFLIGLFIESFWFFNSLFLFIISLILVIPFVLTVSISLVVSLTPIVLVVSILIVSLTLFLVFWNLFFSNRLFCAYTDLDVLLWFIRFFVFYFRHIFLPILLSNPRLFSLFDWLLNCFRNFHFLIFLWFLLLLPYGFLRSFISEKSKFLSPYSGLFFWILSLILRNKLFC